MSTHVPTKPRITIERIEAAARAIDPVFLNTPQWVCEPLAEELGVRVALKVETLNPIRSFKGRGADWLVQNLPPGASLICASAGNFGQAMAYACRKRGVPLTVRERGDACWDGHGHQGEAAGDVGDRRGGHRRAGDGRVAANGETGHA